MSRKTARMLAGILRKIFEVDPGGAFPILDVLEKIPDKFENSNYEVVDDDKLDINNPARCFQNAAGGFTIQIKESVYDGAYRYYTGAYRDHITHELCHVFLFSIGYTPVMDRSFNDNELKAYESVEWQAKAVCGEVMMPYEETKGMIPYEIMAKYGVSSAQAKYRQKY
ncbi:ImmA/IrrE family metallo-endopeptidase [Eubacterium ruminantium]|nr:ImmA/IrrE family metallo-endopeptidase [Eubacterium ruminantium]